MCTLSMAYWSYKSDKYKNNKNQNNIKLLKSGNPVFIIFVSALNHKCRVISIYYKFLKVRFITIVDPKGDRFLISNTVFLSRYGYTALCLKNISQKGTRLCLVAYIFTKLSQNVCLINTHILIYRYARCDYKLWNAFDLIWAFSYIIIDLSCLNCCISTKLSLIVLLINTDMLKCQI